MSAFPTIPSEIFTQQLPFLRILQKTRNLVYKKAIEISNRILNQEARARRSFQREGKIRLYN